MRPLSLFSIPLALGLFGLLTSTIYTALVAWAVRRFLRNRRAAPSAAFLPSVSLLKPLHGLEDDMEAHLETFFLQDYPSFEILFCARSESDPGLDAARRVAARHPHIPARFLICGNPPWPNAKAWSLTCMQPAAKHDILVVSDSDVSVGPGYLRSLASPFSDPSVGLLTCLYRGVATPGPSPRAGLPWSHLEAAGMSVEMSAGVLVADMLQGMNFALGPTMVVRRSSLDRIGGFATLGHYHADDFMLGHLIAAAGDRVLLSRYIVEHHIWNDSLAAFATHQVRWMKSTRVSRPRGHFGTVLTFAMPFGLLASAAAIALHRPILAVACFAFTFLTRALMAALISALVVQDRNPMVTTLLFPLRDLFGFFFWCASYTGSRVQWRGQLYQLQPDGRMTPCSPATQTKPAILTT